MEYEKKKWRLLNLERGGGGEEEGNICYEYMMFVFEGK